MLDSAECETNSILYWSFFHNSWVREYSYIVKKEVRHGSKLKIWNIFVFAWVLLDFCSSSTQVLLELCLSSTRILLELCLSSAWVVLELCSSCAWVLLGFCSGCAWVLLKFWSSSGRVLLKFCSFEFIPCLMI